MINTPRLMAILIGAAFLLLGHSLRAQNSETFKARLSTVPVPEAVGRHINDVRPVGSGSLTAALVGSKLTISGTFRDLLSPATFARVHRGPKGIRGPAIFGLIISKTTSGAISGSLDLTPAQIGDLKNDRLYVQIYSELFPDGELRGWLLR